MTQSVRFTSAALEAFAEAYLSFLVSVSEKKKKKKKKAREIKNLEILKKYVSNNKIFLFKKVKQCFTL